MKRCAIAYLFLKLRLIESLGLVHMNGRVYDPLLGRFLSADPFVQAPTNSQSPNRYSYVFNNPLSFTDPTGYFGWFEGGIIGQIAGGHIGALFGAIYSDALGQRLAQFDYWMHIDQGLGPKLVQTAITTSACASGQVYLCAAVNGAVTLWLTNGDLSQGLKSAAIAYASASISKAIGDAATPRKPGVPAAITSTEAALLHGFSQGTLAVMGEGKFSWRTFGSSFASAYVGHEMGDFKNPAVDIFMAGSLGGVTSRIAGGSFTDGFATAAMVRIFNKHGHHDKEESELEKANKGAQSYFDDLFRLRFHNRALNGEFGEYIQMSEELKADIIKNGYDMLTENRTITLNNGKTIIMKNYVYKKSAQIISENPRSCFIIS